MRISEVNLFEQAELRQDLQQLVNLGKKDPSKKSIVANALKKIKVAMQKALGQQVENEISEQSIDATINADLMAILQLDPSVVMKKPKLINDIQKYIQKIQKASEAKGRDVERTDIKTYIKDNEAIIEQLAQKVVKELKVYAESSGENNKGSADKLADLGMVKQKLESALSGVFSEMVQGATADPGRRKAVNGFLKALVKGLVPFDDIINKKQGNINDIVKSQLSKSKSSLYDEIAVKLMNTIPSIGKGTNWGPGELGLALISAPASKGSKGDLETTDGRMIEVKASQKPEAGARLGTETGGGSLKTQYQQLLIKYFPKQKPKYNFSYIGTRGKKVEIKLNLLERGLKQINALILKEPDFKTMAFLMEAILLPFRGDTKKLAKQVNKQHLQGVVNADKTIEYKQLVRAITQIYYDFYGGETTEGKAEFKIIMIMNPNTGTYKVLDNVDSIGNAIRNGEIIATGGIDFDEKMFPKGPQLGIK